ncbi:MAG: DUF4143 domain-containing protein [Rhodocyclaceae bacterium]|nr:DUF4143 domain-containing protein [Rhodocyclaceae bacterium]
MLEATFQWFELPAFSGNPVKRVSARPKGYLADTGLACHHAGISSPRTLGGHPLFGALICAVAEPRWIADDVFAIPWNLLEFPLTLKT